jgi:hypothetical protein
VVGDRIVIAGDEVGDRLWIWDPATSTTTVRRLQAAREIDDIEGLAAWDASTFFAICSQSLNKHGERKPKRERFARLRETDDGFEAQVHRSLRDDLGTLLRERLGDRLRDPDAVLSAVPECGGLSVEGIVRDGDRILIGLRSPTVRGGGAILVPLVYPLRLFGEDGAVPELGSPIVLPVEDGLGIRDLTRDGDWTLVLVGPRDDVAQGTFGLFRWKRGGEFSPVRVPGWDRLSRPEGVAVLRDRRLVVVQDLESGEDANAIVLLRLPTQ